MDERLERVLDLVAAEPVAAGAPAGLAGVLQRICFLAARTLRASGAGISLMSENGTRGIGAVTDPRTEQLEESQFALKEGPGLEAFGTRRAVVAADLDAGPESRWPEYRFAARAAGVRAVFAFPLRMGAARLGVLTVLREEPGPLSRDDVVAALDIADTAVLVLLDGQGRAAVGAEVDGESEALDYRAELFQAQGMVMVSLGIPLTDALVRLRAHAWAHNRSLTLVAREVVVGTLRIDADTG